MRCGGSAGCVLCVLWAVPAAVLGGVPYGGKHIIIVYIVSGSEWCSNMGVVAVRLL